jgi:glycosyltransferase involved in cell wall biosynthesis
MAERKKICLIYQYNENWIGGTYYIENLISALNWLHDDVKPELIIFTAKESDYIRLKSKTGYPYLTYRSYLRKLTLLERIINKLSRGFVKKNLFFPFHKDLDLVFPATNENRFNKNQLFLYWIPDFQEHFLPEFFTLDEIKHRKEYQQNLLSNSKYILFSSNSVKNDFNIIYPENKLTQFVVQFAVTHPSIKNVEGVIEKYQLPENYFICNNQFWKHKNHSVILRAIYNLKQKGIEIFVAFTGREHDYRNPEYFSELKIMVENLSLNSNVKFLGFIDRADQLSLMKLAFAVIQPSLFEGWSTVVEDAKSLGLNIIASDLDVHKEQLQNYPCKKFFSAKDDVELSEIMLEPKSNKFELDEYKYDNEIFKFAKSFSNAVETVTLKH